MAESRRDEEHRILEALPKDFEGKRIKAIYNIINAMDNIQIHGISPRQILDIAMDIRKAEKKLKKETTKAKIETTALKAIAPQALAAQSREREAREEAKKAEQDIKAAAERAKRNAEAAEASKKAATEAAYLREANAIVRAYNNNVVRNNGTRRVNNIYSTIKTHKTGYNAKRLANIAKQIRNAEKERKRIRSDRENYSKEYITQETDRLIKNFNSSQRSEETREALAEEERILEGANLNVKRIFNLIKNKLSIRLDEIYSRVEEPIDSKTKKENRFNIPIEISRYDIRDFVNRGLSPDYILRLAKRVSAWDELQPGTPSNNNILDKAIEFISIDKKRENKEKISQSLSMATAAPAPTTANINERTGFPKLPAGNNNNNSNINNANDQLSLPSYPPITGGKKTISRRNRKSKRRSSRR